MEQKKMIRYSLLLDEQDHYNLKKKAYARLQTISDYIREELCQE